MYQRIKEWSEGDPNGRAGVHAFRKTSLQHAHDGEESDIGQTVAIDAGVSRSVLLKHYVRPKLWRRSNRTYFRLVASFSPAIAELYGHTETEHDRLERELQKSKDGGDCLTVARIAKQLSEMDGTPPSAEPDG